MTPDTQLQHVEKLCNAGNSEAIQTWSLQVAKGDITLAAKNFIHIEAYLTNNSLDVQACFDCLDAMRPMHSLLSNKLFGLLHPDESISSAHNLIVCNAILALTKSELSAFQLLLKRYLKKEIDHETLAIILHRALATQLKALLSRQKLKLPIPQQYWKNLHQFFLLANRYQLMSFRFCDGAIAWDQRLSVENLYCMALLLKGANLNQLSETSINNTFDLLCENISLVSLSVSPTDNDNEIAVDISSSEGPKFKTLLQDQNNKQLIYLQIHGLLRKLALLVSSQSSFSVALFEHLHSAWDRYVQREQRQVIEQDIQICLNFEDLHYYLSGNQNLEDFIGVKAKLSIAYDEDEDIAKLEGGRSQNIFNAGVVELKGDTIKDEIPDWTHLQHNFPIQNKHTKTSALHTVLLVDKSESGCRLRWQGDDIPLLDVGSMLSLSMDTDNNEWLIGEVAWLNHQNHKAIETGIKILSRAPIPVAVDVPLKACMHTNFLPGILLPPNKAKQHETRFIVGRYGYEVGDQVHITQGGQETAIQLEKLQRQFQDHSLFSCGFFPASHTKNA